MLEILLDDEDESRGTGQAEPESHQPQGEVLRLRAKGPLRDPRGTNDDPELVQPPHAQTEHATRGREDDCDRGAPCPIVSGVSERLVESSAVGQQKHEVMGDDEGDRRHRHETEEASRARHAGDYTANGEVSPSAGRRLTCYGITFRPSGALSALGSADRSPTSTSDRRGRSIVSWSPLHPGIERWIGIHRGTASTGRFGAQFVVPGFVAIDLAQPVPGAVPG